MFGYPLDVEGQGPENQWVSPPPLAVTAPPPPSYEGLVHPTGHPGDLEDDKRERAKGFIFEVTARIVLSVFAVLITTVLVFIIIIRFTTVIKGVNRKKVLPILMWLNFGLIVLTGLATMLFRPNRGGAQNALLSITPVVAFATSALVHYGSDEKNKSSSLSDSTIDVMVVITVAFSAVLIPMTVYNTTAVKSKAYIPGVPYNQYNQYNPHMIPLDEANLME